MRKLVALLALALVTVGCPKKATWFHNQEGGYTLITDVRSVEQAMIRFHRTANDLCGPGRYQLTEPTMLREGWNVTAFGSGPILSMKANVTCLDPS
jgi:hypothetical protein